MPVRPTNLLALLALPALPAAAAPYLGPLHWSLDLLACFPVQAMGCLWVAALALLAARRWRLAAPYGLGALAATFAVAPAWFGAPAAAAAGGPPLRVASLNLLRGNESSLPGALAAVRAYDPDVLFCAEVTPQWLDGLRAALPDYPHRCLGPDPGWFGVALFSRLPLQDAAVLPLGFPWAPAIRAVVTTAAGPVGLLGVHTPRPGGARRNRERDEALLAIPAAIASLPEVRLVLGDCNATPWNRAFRDLLSATGMAAATAWGFHPTWPAQLPWPLRIPIDHLLVGAGVVVTEVRTGPAYGSDHLPLFAELRLQRP